MVIILVVIVALVVLSALDRDRWPQSSEEEGRIKRSSRARRLPARRRTRRSPSVLSFREPREDSSSSARWWWE